MAAKWWLSNSSTHSIFPNQPSSFIPLSIYYWHGLTKLLSFFSGLKSTAVLNYLGAQTIPELAQGSPSKLAPVTCPHHFHKRFFTVCCNKMFQAHHCLPGVSPFPEKPWILSQWEMVLEMMGRAPDVLTAPGCLCLLALSADRSQTICMFEHTYTRTHTHAATRTPTGIHTYVHILLNHHFTLIPPQGLSFALLHTCVSYYTVNSQALSNIHTLSHLLHLLSQRSLTILFILLPDNQVY